jgi:hypothetical protein
LGEEFLEEFLGEKFVDKKYMGEKSVNEKYLIYLKMKNILIRNMGGKIPI